MEPRGSNTPCWRILLVGFTLCVALFTEDTSAVDIHADPVVVVQNGTTGILRCSFKSSEGVTSFTTVTWSFQSSQPDNQFSNAAYVIFYFYNGKGTSDQDEFKDRVKFIGDINKRDVSIQLSPAQFSDNGTFFCDVKNPPDVKGTQARTELRVVLKESLPHSNTAMIVGGVCGALFVLVLIAVAACFLMRMLHNRHDYEGCTSLESVSSQAQQPRKKAESSREGSRCTSPSGPLQVGAGGQRNPLAAALPSGPVIYAQLDHSGSRNSFHKMEPVVYADIRKN